MTLSENRLVERYRAVCGTKFTIRKPSKWKPILISTSIWTVCFAMCIPEWLILVEGTKMKFRIQKSMHAIVEMQLIRLSFGNLSKDDSQPAIISTLQDDTVSVTLFQL